MIRFDIPLQDHLTTQFRFLKKGLALTNEEFNIHLKILIKMCTMHSQVRLRELRWRRSAETAGKEVEHLRSLTYSQQSKIDALEEELLRHETLLEKRQLDWEARELQVMHAHYNPYLRH